MSEKDCFEIHRKRLDRINLDSRSICEKIIEPEIPLVKGIPNWNRISPINAEVVLLKDFKSRSELKLEMEPFYAENIVQIKIASSPFSKGVSRFAYYAYVCNEGTWKVYIVKKFIKERNNEKSKLFLEQNEQNKIAVFLADRWNSIVKTKTDKKIEYLEARIVTIKMLGKQLYYNLEELADGEWNKWTNNAGFVEHESPQLLSFSKWTHDYTKGYMMITDVQGVEHHDRFLLSDPAVLCTDEKRFCETNLYPEAQIKICLEAIEHGLKGESPDFPVSKKTAYHLHSRDLPT